MKGEDNMSTMGKITHDGKEEEYSEYGDGASTMDWGWSPMYTPPSPQYVPGSPLAHITWLPPSNREVDPELTRFLYRHLEYSL